MEFKEICKRLRDLLGHITHDLGKAEGGNKAASQRVRTGTVKLEKLAKNYRKESIVDEKRNKGSKKSAKKAVKKVAGKATKPAAKVAPKKVAAKATKPAPKAAAKKVAPKAAPKAAPKKVAVKAKAAPAKSHKAVAKPHAFALRKPTAKLPGRK